MEQLPTGKTRMEWLLTAQSGIHFRPWPLPGLGSISKSYLKTSQSQPVGKEGVNSLLACTYGYRRDLLPTVAKWGWRLRIFEGNSTRMPAPGEGFKDFDM
jgi:hypothetical protein